MQLMLLQMNYVCTTFFLTTEINEPLMTVLSATLSPNLYTKKFFLRLIKLFYDLSNDDLLKFYVCHKVSKEAQAEHQFHAL